MNKKHYIERTIILLTCLLTLSIFTAAVVLAEEPGSDAANDTGISYVDRSWDGNAKQLVSTDKTTDESVDVQPVPDNGNMKSGWYYLDRNITKDGRVESINGDVHLILGDGFQLDVKGLYVPPGSTLTIYGQSEGTGRLYSHPSGGAAIGGYSKHDNGNIVIKGGTIDAYGYDHCAGIGSNDGRKGGYIEIYGGTITAKGGSDGAGIGGGRDCNGGNITIYGGTIKANEDPNEDAAAIGGGDDGEGGNITIWGGNITAWSRDGAGIGGGADAEAGVITINGGEITVWDSGEGNGARIGSGDNAPGGEITINDGKITVYHRDGAGIGCAEDGGDGGVITINGGEIWAYDRGQANGAGIGGGNNSFGGDITINGGKIHSHYRDGAGIGGGENRSGGEITINGGEINCKAGEGSEGNGAGIGGGNNGDGGTINIYDGSIGIENRDGAGIGGGDDGTGGEINIYGGSIYIKGPIVNEKEIGNGAGIGGGNHSHGGNITIENGNITIIAYDGAGIGGGREDDTFLDLTGESGYGGNITINGGRLSVSSFYAYAIGAGGPSGRAGTGNDPFSVFTSADIGDAGNIKITGGYIEVNGDAGAAAIGGDGGEIEITGGTITPIMHADHKYSIRLMGSGKVNISGGSLVGRMVRADDEVRITGGTHSFSRTIDGKRPIESDRLILGDNMLVKASTAENGYKEENQVPVPVADRIKRLQEKGNGDLNTTVKVCDHPGITYTTNAQTHTGHCDYCKTGFTAEAHDFENGICKVCGYSKGDRVVTFVPDNGTDPYNVSVENGMTVARPEKDPVREGFVFGGWYQVTGTDPETLAGEEFDFDTPVTKDITLKALWTEVDDTWTEPVYTWAGDNSEVTASRTKKTDPSVVEKETVKTQNKVLQVATCVTRGETLYYAVFTNKAFKAQKKTAEDIDPLGHDWGETTYKWSDDLSSVTASRKCARDRSHTEEETVNTEKTETAPTCEEDGEIIYAASFKNPGFTVQMAHTKIPALGHDWGEWTVTKEATEKEEGAEERVCKHDDTHRETRVIPVIDHMHQLVRITAKAATCTEDGNREYWICAGCGMCFEDASGSKEIDRGDTVIPAAGHTPGTAEKENIKEPTCEETGHHDEVVRCRKCGKEITRVSVTDEALGHDWGEWTTVKEPGETEEGLEERVCKNDDTHKESRAIPVVEHVHNLKQVNAREATCTEDGVVEHWICSEGANHCGRYFSDAEGTKEINKEDTVIPAAGHTYDTDKVVIENEVPPTCEEEGHHDVVAYCKVCGEEFWRITVTDKALGHKTRHVPGDSVEPTCETDGYYSFSEKCEVCGEVVSGEMEYVNALGHDWGEAAYKWSDDLSEVTATRACARDKTHIETETVETAHSHTDPTCVKEGEDAYVAAFENPGFSIQMKNTKIPAEGHKWGAWTTVKEPTETEEGLEKHVCERCGEEEERIIPAKVHEHKLIHINSKQPDCTEDGNREYWICADCGKCFEDAAGEKEIDRKDTVIPASGHSYGNVETGNVVEPTCEKAGHHDEFVRCTVCGKESWRVTVEDEALGHDWGDWRVIKQATEKREGTEERVCRRDPAHRETRSIPVIGHVHNLSHVSEKEATCTGEGVREHWVCSEGENACGKYFSDAAGENEINEDDTVIPAKGHISGKEEIENVVEPSCEKDGSHDIVVYCKVCGGECWRIMVTDKAVGHRTRHVPGDSVEPTCEKDGYYSFSEKCEVCGEVVSGEMEYVNALGHDWSSWKVTKEPSQDEEGEETRTCQRCGEEETRPISKLDPDDPSDDEDTTPSDDTKPSDDDGEPAAAYGVSFRKLQLKSTKQTENSVTITWKKVTGAKSYVIYGNKCGKNNKVKRLGKTSGNSKKFTKVLGKRVRKGTYYKFRVVALDKNNKKIATSRLVHAATKGGKVGNHKSVTVKKSVIAKAKKLKKGKPLKLNAKAVKAPGKIVKIHSDVSYESSNKKIATVSKKGVVKGKKKGTCYIYAYAQNGVFRKIRVVVR